MIKLTHPNLSVADCFDTCVEGVRSARKSRFKKIRSRVMTASQKVSKLAPLFATGLPSRSNNSAASKKLREDMIWLYNSRFKGKKCRYLFEELQALADDCPFCETQENGTLDHVMPKSQFPLLAVTPLNLVACCYVCNGNRNSRRKAHHKEMSINPYFDNLDTSIWLFAEVQSCKPLRIRFYTKMPAKWSPTLRNRALQEIDILNLEKRFQKRVVSFFNGKKNGLRRMFRKGKQLGPSSLKSHLKIMESSERANRKNSWQAAVYRALAKSTEFCSGQGF